MPHLDKRKPGPKTYCDYTEETVERALRTRCSKSET